jgi:hypothetical protein
VPTGKYIDVLVMHVTVSFERMRYLLRNQILLSYGGLDMTAVDYAHRSPRTAHFFERRHATSDGLVAVVLWSVGGLALTLLVIWLGSGAEFLSLG